MSKIILKGYILVPDADLPVIEQQLPVHTRLTREEAGCITFQVTSHPGNPNRFDVYEEFIDKASFDYHQARVKISRWGEVTSDVERHYEIFES